MNDRLNDIVQNILDGKTASVGVLSTGERCFVAIAANRYDLLPSSYADPIEAWQRLEPEWRAGVCEWRGWPRGYANG